jgi:uncharacterized protein YecT (DUF1311 family)
MTPMNDAIVKLRGIGRAFVRISLLSGMLLTACGKGRSNSTSEHASAGDSVINQIEPLPALPEDSIDCGDASTTMEIRICLATELDQLEQSLIAVEDSIRERLPDPIGAELSRADHAWKAYVEAECSAAEMWYDPGTITPLVALGCRIDLAKQRRIMLRSLFFHRLGSDSSDVPHPDQEQRTPNP